MGKYKIRARTVFVLALIITLALAMGPTIRTLAAETIFKIQNAELTSISDGAEGTIASFDESNIISNVVFHHLNDSATYKITLKNSDSKDHIIETITDDNENSYISYNYNKHENELINAGNDLVFDLTATYSTANTDSSARVQSTNVKFYIQFTDVEEPVEIDLDVPNTGVNTIAKTTSEKNQETLKTTLGIIIAASAGLIIIAVIAVKKHKKFAKVTAAFVIAGTAFAIAANVRAVVTEINSFTITTEYGLYDKLVIQSGDEDIIIDYGTPLEDIDEITDPTKTGYIFDGWTDEDGNDVDPTSPIIKDITLTPKFTAITYTIKFHDNGAPADQQMPDQVLTYDEAQNLTANTFTWEGRTYTGWDTTAAGNGTYYEDGQEVKNLTTINNDVIDLYAQWSINPYHIAYDNNGGEGEMAQTNCEYDQDCQLRQNAFTRYGYDFKGWTFDNNNYDDEATVRNLATSGTITMVAKWEAHEYEIHYSGLTTEEEEYLRSEGNPDIYTIESQSYTLKKPLDRKDADGDVRQHCIGWRDITVFEDITLPITNSLGDKYYEAVWTDIELDRFQITYDYDGGNVATANPTTHNKEESFILNNPTKTGYIFTGWTGTTIEGDTPVHGYTLPNPHVATNINFVAHYTPIQYSIIFDKGADNATGNTAPMNMKYDEAKNLTVNGFERTGYTFAGWKDADGNDYNDGAEVINLTTTDEDTITLTAQWTPNSFVVVYYPNSSEVTNQYAMLPQNVTYDTQATLNANIYERPHYKFMGWATSATGDKVYDDQADITNALSEDGGILNLYAVWKERTAILDTGPNVNAVLRSFAEEPQSFSHFNGTPDFETIQNKQNIALASSNFPVYAWYDETDQAIYWWSEAERPQLNTASAKLFSGTHTENNASVNNSLQNLKSIDLTGLDASSTLYMDSMFANTTSLESLNLNDFDSSSAVNMVSMFYGTNLASIDLSQIESQNVTDMTNMFSNSKFGSIDASKLNTQSVTKMSGMFRNAAATTITFFDNDPTDSLFDTSKVTDMASMFYGVHAEELDLRNFNTEKVLTFSSMFLYADPIKKLDVTSFNTSNATNMGYMFDQLKNLEELDVTGFNTSKVTNMSNMFNSCAKLTELDVTNFDTSKVTIMDGMFAGLKNMEVLDLSSFDTGKVTTMYYYFVETNKLKTVYISDLWSTDALSSHGTTFFQSQSTITGGAGTRMAQNSTSDIYARIDDPDNNGKKGMFTYKNARYIRYYDNDGDDTNNEANYALMPSHYITTDSNNPYTLATALSENKFERPGYRFLGWATSADGEKLYDDKAAISTSASKDPLKLYAVWYKLEATLDTGANVNAILRDLAEAPTAFEHYTAGTPDFSTIDGEQDIALATSDVPVYAWYDTESTKIYWWSEAEKPKMNTDSSTFFAGMSSVTSIDVEGLDASNATNMSHMFRGTGLTNIDLSKLDSQNVTDMSYMFYGIKKTYPLDVSKLDTSSVKNMASMFEDANFTSISFHDALNPSASKFKTNEVTSMHYMFRGTTKLTSLDLSSFNTSNVRDFSGTFYSATGLNTLNLDGWDTGKATSMYIMFNGATSLTRLDLRHFNTKNVTNMQQMFEGCFNLEYLNVSGWSNEAVQNMSYMFHKVGNYKNGVQIILTDFKTPAVTTMAYMFSRDVTELEALDLSGFDTSNVTSMSSMFGGGSQGNGTFYNAKIKTVYASDKFVTTNVDPESNVFNNTSVIVGGAGTTWRQKTADYARIDDPDNGKPGYFTMKNARYIRYHDNDGDDTNDEANNALMPSHYVTTDSENPYTLATKLTKNSFERDGYIFLGWATSAENAAEGTIAYVDEATISGLEASKTPYELYAVWRVENTKFIVGAVNNANPSLNKVFKSYETDEKKVRSIQRSATAPNLDEIDETIISTADSDYEIYAWFNDETETVYWYTQSKKPLMNSPAGAFAGLAYVTSIDISTADTGAAESMESMFSGDKLLTSVNYGDNFVTDQVKNMASMFKSTGFTELDLTSWNVENVTTTNSMFYEMQSLATINLSNWNTKSLKNIYRMFYNDKILSTESLNASVRNWNVENLEEAGGAFENLKSITALDLSNWHTTEKLTSMDYMFRFNNLLEVVDISNFNTSNVARVYSLTQSLPALRTIYVGEAEPFKNATGQEWSFNGATNIVGGNGTTYSNGPTGDENWRQAYRIDDPAHGAPGFLTYKNPLVVTFDAGEGTASRESYNYIPSTDYGTLPTVSGIPEGKVFDGWYTAAEGGEKVNDNDAFVSSEAHTLYAHFSLRFMQDMTADALDTLIPNNGDTITLYDNRDNKAYTVGRLADGNVWLLENLRLDPTEVSLDTLKGNTNASDASLEYLKGVRTGTADDQYAMAAVSSTWPTSADNYAKPFVNTSRADTVISDGYEGKAGVYYNYCAATAGSYCYGDGSDVSNATTAPESAYGTAVGDAWEDICPAGWRLPTASDTGEYKALYDSYSEHSDLKNAFRATFSSTIREGTLFGNPEAYYWAPNQGSTSGVMVTSAIFNNTAWNYSYIGRQYGLSVRCIFNKNYMQSTPESLLGFLMPNDGDTTTLYDKRDGKAYEVANINGTYWMADNLDLAGGTVLTSALSNVETDYTLPASSIDGFKPASYTGVYNSNNTECAEGTPCYSYYDYNVATAGTNPSSGDATSDICPAGWRLPTIGEYNSLASTYPKGTDLVVSPFAEVYAGYFEEGSGTFWHGGVHGYIYSSTAVDANDARYLSVHDPQTYTSYTYKLNGRSVRCVAK